MPDLTRDVWSTHNNILKTLLGPLHFDLSSKTITPPVAADTFNSIVIDFLSCNDEFLADEKKTQSKYVQHDSLLSKKLKLSKISLEKRHSEKMQVMRTGKHLNKL